MKIVERNRFRLRSLIGFGILLLVISLPFVINSSQRPASSQSDPFYFGINLVSSCRTCSIQPLSLETSISSSVLSDTGLNYLRISGTSDVYPYTNVTDLLNHYASSHFNIDYVCCGYLPPGYTRSDWDAAVRNSVNALPAVHTWEILDEITGEWESCYANSSDCGTGYVFSGGAADGPQDYLNMIADASNIIKNATGHSSDTIICYGGNPAYQPGEMSLYNKGQYNLTLAYSFVRQVWELGASKYCNATSIHVYPHGGYLLDQYPPTSNQTLGKIIAGVINSYWSATSDTPVWITETGYPASSPSGQYQNSSLKTQSTWLAQVYPFLEGFSYIRAIFWWDEVGQSPAATRTGALTWDDFGLFNATTLQPEPAFSVLTSLASSSKVITASTSSSVSTSSSTAKHTSKLSSSSTALQSSITTIVTSPLSSNILSSSTSTSLTMSQVPQGNGNYTLVLVAATVVGIIVISASTLLYKRGKQTRT